METACALFTFMVCALEKPKCPFCHSWLMAVFGRIVSLQPVWGLKMRWRWFQLRSWCCAEGCPVELFQNYPWFKAEMRDLFWADGEQNWNGFREVGQEIKVQPCGLWVKSQGSSSIQHEFCNVTQGQTLAQGILLCLLSRYEKEVYGHPQPFWSNLLLYFDMWW